MILIVVSKLYLNAIKYNSQLVEIVIYSKHFVQDVSAIFEMIIQVMNKRICKCKKSFSYCNKWAAIKHKYLVNLR